jgi:hypothetical protein
VYRFQGLVGDIIVSGIFHNIMNTFIHLNLNTAELSSEDLEDIKQIVRTEIQEKENIE